MAFTSDWVADPGNIAIISALLGIIAHIGIIPFEIDEWSPYIFRGLILSWGTLFMLFAKGAGMTTTIALQRANLATASFLAAAGTSMVIYRLFFHRLRHFPGPFSAKITRFSAMYDAHKSGLKYHNSLEKLHEKYGDFVRVGPRSITINRASAVPLIHGPFTRCRKSPWYSIVTDGNPHHANLVAIRDGEIHRLRRRVWRKSLDKKALEEYLPRIERKADLFIKRMHERANTSIDATQWSTFYTFDVMGLIAFSKDYQQLDEGTEHFAIAAMHGQMKVIGLFTAVPWLSSIILSLPGMKGASEVFKNYATQQIEQRKLEWKQDLTRTPQDVISWLWKAVEDGIEGAPFHHDALYDDGRLVIVAGSDTTGATLANMLYFFAKYPHTYQRLQNEVDEIKSNGGDVAQAPYLNAIITETLRLRPAVPSGLNRLTPPEGIMVDEVWIPGDTHVIAPQHVIQRSEKNFEKALEFIPERWLDEGKHLFKDDRAWFPFSIGLYSCIGKQMALMQLQQVLHRIASEFDISFASKEAGDKFIEETQDHFTMLCPSLDLIFSKRMSEA